MRRGAETAGARVVAPALRMHCKTQAELDAYRRAERARFAKDDRLARLEQYGTLAPAVDLDVDYLNLPPETRRRGTRTLPFDSYHPDYTTGPLAYYPTGDDE